MSRRNASSILDAVMIEIAFYNLIKASLPNLSRN
jgi:hypothetical protein